MSSSNTISFNQLNTIGSRQIDKVIVKGNLLIVSSGCKINVYRKTAQEQYESIWENAFSLPQNCSDLAVGHGHIFICTGINPNNVSSGSQNSGMSGGDNDGGMSGGDNNGGMSGGDNDGGMSGGDNDGGMSGGDNDGGISDGGNNGGMNGGDDNGGMSGGDDNGGMSGGDNNGGMSGGGTNTDVSLAFIVLELATGKKIDDWNYISNIKIEINQSGGGSSKKEYMVPSNVVASNDQLVFSDQAGTVYGLDFETKKLFWFTPDPKKQSPQSHIALAHDAAFFINYQDNVLYAMNFASQVERWSYPQPASPRNFAYQTPVLSEEAIFVSLKDGSIQALSLSGRKESKEVLDKKGKQQTEYYTASELLYDTINNTKLPTGQSWNLPAIDDKNDIVFLTSQQYLAVLRLSTGDFLFSQEYPSEWTSGSAVFKTPLIYSDPINALEINQHQNEYTIIIPDTAGNLYSLGFQEDLKKANQPEFSTSFDTEAFNLSDTVTVNEQGTSIGDGLVILPTSEGIVPVNFGNESVIAMENNSYISFANSNTIGASEFSIETWVQSSKGGTILSQDTDGTNVGFQLEICNISDEKTNVKAGQGRLRFMISDGTNMQGVQSVITEVCNGHWHHIAIVRSKKDISVFLDGKALSCEMWNSKANPFDIPLALNSSDDYFCGAMSATDTDGIIGSITELRLWKKALSLEKITNRMGEMLTGTEKHLLALLQVETQGTKNIIERVSNTTPTSANTNFILSDLNLKDNLFPVLIHSSEETWPYNESWILEGENNVTSSPSGNGHTIGFGCGNVFYAVDEVKGSRKWEWNTINTSHSFTIPAVCDKDQFYLPETESSANNPYYLHAIDAKTGQLNWDWKSSTDCYSEISPIISEDLVIICPDNKNIYALSKASGSEVWSFEADDTIRGQLSINGNRLFYIDGENFKFFSLDQSNKKSVALYEQPSNKPINFLLAVDGKRAFIYNGAKILAYDSSKLTPAEIWNPDLSKITGKVCSLQASSKHNRLYLGTKTGELLALDYGSGKEVFYQKISTSSCYVSQPQVSVIFCTTAEGIETYDAKSGVSLGAYSSTTQPFAAPAIINNHTAVFAGQDKHLHSVVFGNDFALHLDGSQSQIKKSDQGRLVITDAEEFSFETWFNTQSGGGLFAMNNSAGEKVQLNINITSDGTIEADISSASYSCSASATSALTLDGHWHELAIVVKKGNQTGADTITMLYLDGKQMSGLKNHALKGAVKFPASGEVLFGENASGTKFNGLLKEIRLWNESLLEAEIHGRMHIQLRGNEPNLLACWDMNARSIFDSTSPSKAISGSTPKSVVNSQIDPNLSFWLTSLHLVKPKYPYMNAQTVAGTVTTSTSKQGILISSASYTTTITVRNYDGSPRPKTKVGLWSNIAADVTIGSSPKTSINSTDGIEATTDDNGQVIVNLSCTDTHYSPEFTVWADYMYPNERIHVSSVMESKTHIVIPPPQLSANVKILTDYNYAHGDGSSNFDKTETAVTQIALSVTDHNGVGVPGETLEVWASNSLQIKNLNKPYNLTAHNGERFVTDMHGEVILYISKNNSKIKSPKLIVHGLFQPRTDTFIVDPSVDAHKKLSKLTGEQLKGDTPIDPTDSASAKGMEEKKKFLPTKMQSSAHDLAHSVSSIATTIKGKPKTGQAADAGVSFSDAPYPSGLDKESTEQAVPARKGTFTAKAASLNSMPNQNFVITISRDEKGKINGFTKNTDSATHQAALDKFNKAMAKPNNQMGWSFGGFFSHIGHDIEHVGSDIVHGVESVAEKAAHLAKEGIEGAAQLVKDGFDAVGLHQVGSFVVTTVQTVVKATGEVMHHIAVGLTSLAGKVLNFIIKTVEDVAHAIEKVFLAIEKAIEEVINFLKALFDWEAIIDIHNNFSAVITDQINKFATSFSGFSSALSKNGFGSTSTSALPSHSLSHGMSSDSDTITHSKKSYSSSKSKWIKHKSNSHQPTSTVGSLNTTSSLSFSGIENDFETALKDVVNQLLKIVENPGQLIHSGLKDIVNLFESLFEDAEKIATDLLPELVKLVEEFLATATEVMQKPIDIFFISDLYKWITGNQLTLQDLSCLILAVPVHIAMVFVGGTYTAMSNTSFSFSSEGNNSMGGNSRGDLLIMGIASLAATTMQNVIGGLKRSKAGDAILTIAKVTGFIWTAIKTIPTVFMHIPHTLGGIKSWPVIVFLSMAILVPILNLVYLGTETLEDIKKVGIPIIALLLISLNIYAWTQYSGKKNKDKSQKDPAFSLDNSARVSSSLALFLKPILEKYASPAVFAIESFGLAIAELALQIAAEAES